MTRGRQTDPDTSRDYFCHPSSYVRKTLKDGLVFLTGIFIFFFRFVLFVGYLFWSAFWCLTPYCKICLILVRDFTCPFRWSCSGNSQSPYTRWIKPVIWHLPDYSFLHGYLTSCGERRGPFRSFVPFFSFYPRSRGGRHFYRSHTDIGPKTTLRTSKLILGSLRHFFGLVGGQT